MTKPIEHFDYRQVPPEGLAILLDFDGTLSAIAAKPGKVVFPDRARRALVGLQEALGGAIAIVSGRPIEDIDRLTAPATFPVAGIHGLVRRDAAGELHQADVDWAGLRQMTSELRAFADAHDGLFLETKPGATALHFRGRPELETVCETAVRDAVSRHRSARVVRGKMVIEIKAGSRTKADAVRDFMGEPPFAGRLAVYAGDDVTDEDAFVAVRELGGVAIKIGPETTCAEYSVGDTDRFLDWLAGASAHYVTRQEGPDLQARHT